MQRKRRQNAMFTTELEGNMDTNGESNGIGPA